MKLLIDDQGHAVLKDGKPVYKKDDGTEVVFDAAQAFGKIGQLTGENTAYKKRFEEAESRLKAFEGIDDPAAALKAIEMARDIDAGKLVQAGKLEEVKAAVQKAADEKYQGQVKQLTENLARVTAEKDSIVTQLHEEVIGGGFARSKLIAEKKVVVPADMMRATFGRAFKVEDGKVVAVDAAGNPIYSKSRMGELADFDEALEILIDQYPHKEQILTGSGASGSGAAAIGSNGGGKPAIKDLSQAKTREERIAVLNARIAAADS